MLTNKYSEGYPGRRYYEGQQFIDPIETIAGDRAKALFGVDHANVQPYSGSPANLAVYLAFAQPGDTDHGHVAADGRPPDPRLAGLGRPASGSTPSSTGCAATPAGSTWTRCATWRCKERPKIIFCGGTAIPRTIDFPAFAAIAAEVGALLVADIAHIAGPDRGRRAPVARRATPPVITTTTHKTLRGPRGAMIMSDAEHATAVDKAVFPGLQGGPHNHTTAAIAVALREAAQPSFRDYAAQVVANAQALGRGAAGPRLRPGLRRHRQPPAADRPDRQGHRRQARRQGAGPGRHRAELQRGAVRPAQAVRPVRPPARHAGDHHPRPARGAHAALAAWMDEAITAAGQGRRGAPWTASPARSATCWRATRSPAGAAE